MDITILITTFTWISWKTLNSPPRSDILQDFSDHKYRFGIPKSLIWLVQKWEEKEYSISKAFPTKKVSSKTLLEKVYNKTQVSGLHINILIEKRSIISNFLINKKTADVIPDFKQEDKTAPKNYWLLSVLQTLSKNIWNSNSKTNSHIYRLIFFTSFVWI